MSSPDAAEPPPLRLVAGVATHIGRVRAVNQDAAAAEDTVVVVADGMGGHNGGEVASQVAVEAFLRTLAEPTVEAVVAAVNRANEAILERADEDPSLAGMGTTLCALVVVEAAGERALCVANVGDSRAYLFADGTLSQISEDHSLVAGLVRQGRLRAEEAERHPQRNILTRALGVEPRVLVDAWEVVPVSGDRYLLCSDGLFNEVSADGIAAVLRRLADPQEAADELVRLANDGGGRDNITVVVADVVSDGDGPPVSPGVRTTRARRAVADIAGFSTAGDAGPADDAPAPASTWVGGAVDEPAGRSRPRRRPRFSWRALLFLLLLGGVLAVAGATVAALSNSGYFVGIDEGEVVIFEGTPGGFLWMEPAVTERSGLLAETVIGTDYTQLEGGVEQDSLADAQRFVEEVRARATAVEEAVAAGVPPPPAPAGAESGDRL